MRLGIRRPHIATKLYGVIALTLAVVCALAAASTRFASQTEQAVGEFYEQSFRKVVLSARAGALLDQQRRLVALAPFAGDDATRTVNEAAYRHAAAAGSQLLRGIGVAQSNDLAQRFDDVARQGTAVFAVARERGVQAATTAAAAYAAAADRLQNEIRADREQRFTHAETFLASLAQSSRSFITWVCAAAAVTGLVFAPLGLFLLRRMLMRLEGIGTALVRLARNDTSVDIPGLDDRDEVGQFARSVAVFKAKSIELLQKKAEIERMNVQLDAAINNMPLGLSMFDAQERLLVCNKRYAEMYELPKELTRPGTVHCALWDDGIKRGARHVLSELDAPGRGAVGLHDHPDSMVVEFGSQRVISVSRQPINGGGWVAVHEDITERRRHQHEISHLARHDALTGLANRVLFREQLQLCLQRLVRGQGFAVLCLDLDRFKSVNDTLGHPVGDILLKQVSERLTSCVRHGDLVARLGGDEFAIIQAYVREPDQTEALAARIVETVSKFYTIDGHRIDISTSIGMTLAPRDGSDADQLLKNADLALYRTKGNGRHGYSFFEPEMNEHIQGRRGLEMDLRKAIANGDLCLHYQPQISLATQAVTGFEALLRWNHPTRGMVPAEEFVSIAEEIGLIGELGAWALDTACAEAARWPAPVRVAINVSPLQVKRDLFDVVLHALASSGLPAERLELEITESVLLQDSQATLAMLHQLRQLGIRIAMDDFGTGYCSLSYLRSFPFDKIKVDRAFVADIELSRDSHAIVGSILGLGKSLGMVTVAEGIESFEQLKLVRALGCVEAQGFFFSPPVPAGEVGRILAEPFAQAINPIHRRDAA